MASPFGIERVVLVVLDGLRPDAISQLQLPAWNRLAARGAATLDATTIAPSVTNAAMASLFTGVAPETHGIRGDHFHVPRQTCHVHPVPRCLRGVGIPTTTFLRSIPWIFRGVASRIGKALGVAMPHFVGHCAADIVLAARRTLEHRKRELIVLHLPDADRAGHEHGWMSDEYLTAARRLDHALGLISAYAHVDDDPRTLMIALADHGGGGVDPRDHDSAHPLDRTIPMLVSGGSARPGNLSKHTTLLDVPATILWSLGVPVPPSYAGRPLFEAFAQLPVAA